MARPTGPRIRNSSGETVYDFQPSFGLQGLPRSRSIPTIQVDGRDGQVVHPDLVHEEPILINVVGEIYAEGGSTASARRLAVRAETDAILKEIGSHKDVVGISADANDDRFLPVRYENINHRFIERTGRTVAAVTFAFRSNDPFWYHTQHKTVEEVIDFTAGPVPGLSVLTEGTYHTYPLIWISGEGGDVVNPKLHNYATGQVIEYTGTIDDGDILVINPFRLTAAIVDPSVISNFFFFTSTFPTSSDIIEGVNVLGNMNSAFLVHGFHLRPGNNQIECFDDAENMKVIMMYRERWL